MAAPLKAWMGACASVCVGESHKVHLPTMTACFLVVVLSEL